MPPDSVKVVSKTTPFKAYLQVDHYLLKHALYEGGVSDVVSREVIERGHVSAVLLYDPELNVLVMTEQFRPGAYAAKTSPWFEDGFSPWLIECVAGIIDKGEVPENVAIREGLEEANCKISKLEPMYHYFSSPGCLTESIYLFCGHVDARNAGGIHGLKHENEDIRVFTVEPEQAFQWVADGTINNSMTMLALLWFQLNGDQLRQKWLEDSTGS